MGIFKKLVNCLITKFEAIEQEERDELIAELNRLFPGVKLPECETATIDELRELVKILR